jgi:hypothetical protein
MFFNLHSGIELALFWVLSSWLFIVVFLFLWSRVTDLKFPKYFLKFQLIWVFLLLLVVGTNYWSRVKYGIPVCFRLPQVSNECMFSLDFPWVSKTLSRFQRSIDFNSSPTSEHWRLSGFNSLVFNAYKPSPDNWSVWEEYRGQRKYPFLSDFNLDSEKIKNLQKLELVNNITFVVKYRGNLSIGQTNFGFSKSEKTISLENFSGKDLEIMFSNYDCLNKGEDLFDCGHDFKINSLSEDDASLVLYIQDKNGNLKLVSTDFFQPDFFLLINRYGFLFLWLVFGSYLFYLGVDLIKKSITCLRQFINFKMLISDLIRAGVFSLTALGLLEFVSLRYLKYYRNLFALDNSMVIMKITFIILVILFSSNIFHQLLKKLIRSGQSQSIVLLLWFLVCLFPNLILRTMPNSRDNVEYYSVGNDQLTYFSWSRDIAKNKALFAEPTIVMSKPLYLYFKSFALSSFGDGNIFVDKFFYWIILSSLMLFFGTMIICLIIYRKKQSYFSDWVTAGFASYVFWYLYLHFNSQFIRNMVQLSEGQAWSLAIFALIWLLVLPFINKNKFKFWLVISGIIWSLTLSFRLTMVIYLLPYLMLVILIRHKIELRKILWFFLPLFLIFAVFASNAIFGGYNPSSATHYYEVNAGVALSNGLMSKMNIYLQNFKKVIPSHFDLPILIIFGFFLLKIILDKKIDQIIKILSIGFILIFVVSHLPLVPTPYYPRGVMFAYFIMPLLILAYWVQVPKHDIINKYGRLIGKMIVRSTYTKIKRKVTGGKCS